MLNNSIEKNEKIIQFDENICLVDSNELYQNNTLEEQKINIKVYVLINPEWMQTIYYKIKYH